MKSLIILASIMAFVAASPVSNTTGHLTFTPLSSFLTRPKNLSSVYVGSVQAPRPTMNATTGLNTTINHVYVINTTQPEPINESLEASCSGPSPSSPSTFWRELIAHNGEAVMLPDPSSFKVWRNVVSNYSADNTGKSDASVDINKAISDGKRAGNGTTTNPAYVFVPGGTYLISSSIQMLVNTFLVGDPLNMPTFIAASSLGTKPIIQGFDSNLQSTTNFYTAIRNIKLDTTKVSTSTAAVALNWAVSQGCSLYDVEFNMPDSSNHIGITMLAPGTEGGGSGTIISDCSFTGGSIGIKLSNQQYNLKGLSFNGCNTCIYVDHLFVGTFQDLSMKNCNYGIDMSNSKSSNVGAISLIDSSVSTCNAGVYTAVTGNGEGSLVLDNYSVDSGTKGVLDTSGKTLLSGGVASGSTWVMGNENPQDYQSGKTYTVNLPSTLVSNGNYFTMPQPQYEKYDVSQFVNVKSVSGHAVYGDNKQDDSAAINAILLANANCKITYFPQGIYKVASTIYIPPGSRLVGDVYSVISGNGSAFWNPDSPVPVVQVGKANSVGVAQITDMIFSVADVLQGAIILQVNMAGKSPGNVGFWNTHLRVGGTRDTLVNTNCGGPDTSDCKAAWALLQITESGGPYIENMWGWTADHSLDGGANQNIATGRGALIQGTKGTWMVGTAFEHNTLYQYNLYGAENVYIGMQQTETAYWQGNGNAENAPKPWTPSTAYGDPTWSNCGSGSGQQCYMGFGQVITNSSNIVIHGSAFWAFFNDMTDGKYSNSGCPNYDNICQQNMAILTDASKLFWYNVETKSTTNMIIDNGMVTAAQVNNPGGWVGSVPGVVAAYLRDSGVAGQD